MLQSKKTCYNFIIELILMKTVSHFINGKIYSTNKSRKGPIFNPAIGEQIAEVELASKATVEMAIKNSSEAFLKWSKTTPINRSRILSKYKDLLINNMEQLANLVSEQHGKTIADAKGSVQRGIEVVEYATGITDSLKGLNKCWNKCRFTYIKTTSWGLRWYNTI